MTAAEVRSVTIGSLVIVIGLVFADYVKAFMQARGWWPQ